MRWWPFAHEKRESSFTDALVQQILSTSTGASLALPTATGALETAAGLVGRAFAGAEVQGPAWAQSALTPACLAMIGRALIRSGQLVLAIDAAGGDLKLWPAADHNVTGGYDPTTWVYRINLSGPSYLTTRTVSAEGVCHFQYMTDPARPWHGVGAIQAASLAGRLSAETMKALADEASGPRGHLLPIPGKDGEDATVTQLKTDLRSLNGQTALVESVSTLQPDRAMAGGDWNPKRLGADPPSGLVELADRATREVLSACGVSPALFDSRAAAAAREAWRQFLFGTVSPLGRIVSRELSAKLEAEVSLDWHELRASDLSGRARAFQSMVGGGMDPARAAALAGLMVSED